MTTSDHNLRAELVSSLAHELGLPLRAVEEAVNTVTADWTVTRKNYPTGNENPLAELRYGHRLVIELPFVPESDAKRTERELRMEAYFWSPEKGAPPEHVGVRQLLRQGEWWCANATPDRGDGVRRTVTIRVEDMTHDHRLGLLDWLRTRAHELHASAFSELGNAPDDVWLSHAYHDSAEWLEGQELVQALVRWTTPYAESLLTWRPMSEAPFIHGASLMARSKYNRSEIIVSWNDTEGWWEGADGFVYIDEAVEWRELRDDEKSSSLRGCEHGGFECMDCETCGSRYYPCVHGGTRDSDYCSACEQE